MKTMRGSRAGSYAREGKFCQANAAGRPSAANPQATSPSAGERKADVNTIDRCQSNHALTLRSSEAAHREAASTGHSRLKGASPRTRKAATEGIALAARIQSARQASAGLSGEGMSLKRRRSDAADDSPAAPARARGGNSGIKQGDADASPNFPDAPPRPANGIESRKKKALAI
ncbi:MAG: hypothetical protein ACTHLN_03370 [Tepidisphaeraceae bacterium]